MVNKQNILNMVREWESLSNDTFRYFKYQEKDYKNYEYIYNISTRSNAKTTASQMQIVLKNFGKSGAMFIKIVRRKENVKRQFNEKWWTEIVEKMMLTYDIHIEYKGGVYYINSYDSYVDEYGTFNKKEWFKNADILGYVIPVMEEQDYKSIDYTKCSTMIFDEFAKKGHFVGKKEVECFKSLVATVSRNTNNIKIFFNGNIIDPTNGYFKMFGINPFDLEMGKKYVYLADPSVKDSARIHVIYSESVTDNIQNLPRVLRISDNAQSLGQLKEFTKPIEIMDYDCQLSYVLQSMQDDFNKFYELYCTIENSVDITNDFTKIGDKYMLDIKRYTVINDFINKITYIIPEYTDDGIRMDVLDYLQKQKTDSDIRNDLPIFKPTYNKVMYGDVQSYLDFKEIL